MLTRIPVRPGDGRTGAAAFGIVGGLVGVAGALPLAALGDLVPAIAAVLSLAAMAVLSGAMHLDGLADTADALVAVGPDGAERARKDPAIGVAGAAALVLVLGLEVASLTSLLADGGAVVASLACVVAGAQSRIVPVVVVRLAPPSRGLAGLGAWFAGQVGKVDAVLALATGIAIVLAAAQAAGRPELLLAGLIGILLGAGLAVGLVRVRHQVDGDLLGAGVELSVAATLAAAAVLVAGPVG